MINHDDEALLPPDDQLYENCEELDVDGVLEKTVPFGRFQILVHILVFCIAVLTASQGDLLYFIGYNPPWTCVHRNSSAFCNANFGKIIKTYNVNFTERCHLSRDEWKYVSKRSSFVTEFDLICDKNSIASLTGAIFPIGAAIGTVIGNTIGDLFGRKPIWTLSLLLAAAASVITSFIGSVWQLILMRFLHGIVFSTGVDSNLVIPMEYVPTRFRPISTNMVLFAILTASLLLDSVAYYENNWRLLYRYCPLPILVFLLFIVLLPESPRWLLSVGKVEKSKAILHRIADINKKPLHDFKLKSNIDLSIGSKYTFIDLLKSRQACKYLVTNAVMSLTIGLILFCSVLQMSNEGGNIYESYAIIIVVSIPAYVVTVPLCYWFGRKKTTLIPYMLSGLMLGVIALLLFLDVSMKYVFVVLNVGAKCLATVAISSYLLWSFELYPTVVRMRSLAFGSFMFQLGISGAPFFTITLQAINGCLPFLIMFIMTLLAVFLGCFLPETKGQPTPETIDDFLGPRVPVNVEIYDDAESFDDAE